jgi:hypothetical protein
MIAPGSRSLLKKRVSQELAWRQYQKDVFLFVDDCCQIYDNLAQTWIPFVLWDFQKEALATIQDNRLVVCLKARQVGLSWLVVAYLLHECLFSPIQDILIFSRRETESIHLLQERLIAMYHHLPYWVRQRVSIAQQNQTYLKLNNGSVVRAFPTGVGDTYTATIAFVDEADLAPDIDVTIASVKPTIDAGGQLILLGRVNKRKPGSPFKQIFQSASLGENGYAPLFIPWHSHPLRTAAWYDKIKQEAINLDDVYEHYPSTPEEALLPASTGRVYPEFSISGNVSPEVAYAPAYEVEWWCDDGYTNPLVILFAQRRHWQGQPDCLVIFDEIYITRTDHDEAIRLALQKPYAPPSVIWCDPSATRLISRFTHVRNYGMLDYGIKPFSARVNAAVNKVADGIKAVRSSIGSERTPRRLIISTRCQNVIREMSQYMLSEHGTLGGDPQPIKENDHTCDAIRYGHTPNLYKDGWLSE